MNMYSEQGAHEELNLGALRALNTYIISEVFGLFMKVRTTSTCILLHWLYFHVNIHSPLGQTRFSAVKELLVGVRLSVNEL